MNNKSTVTFTKQAVITEDLRHMSPNDKFWAIGTVKFPNPFNQDEIVTGHFEIFDGAAFGTAVIDDKEREIYVQYPLLSFVNKTATNMKEKIRKHLNIEEDRNVSVFEIFASYGQFIVID